MRFSVGLRIGVILLTVAAVGAGGMAIVLTGLGRVTQHFGHASKVEEPAMMASHEMELNNNGIGLAVLTYILHRDATLTATIARDVEDFKRNLAHYQRSLRDEREQRQVNEMTQWFAEYWQVAWELVALADSIHNARDGLNNHLDDIDELLEVYASRARGMPIEKSAALRELALAAEAEHAEVSAWVSVYHHEPGPETRARIQHKLAELAKVMGTLRQSVGPGAAVARRIEESGRFVRTSVQTVIELEDERLQAEKTFLGLRDKIDQALDRTVQPILERRLVMPYRAAEIEARKVWQWVLVLIPVFLTAIALVLVILMRVVVKPLYVMRQATMSLAEGQLDVSVPEGRKDEIGDLAVSFNTMVARLKQTTVSRDRLEASERALSSTVDQLKAEIARREAVEGERAEMERAARRSEKLAAVGTLVAGVAHEVRNPLFALSSTLDAMRVRFREDFKLGNFLDVLRGEVTRLSRLMSDLLEYGRPVEDVRTAVAFAQIVQEAAASCGALAEQCNVKLVTLLDANIPRVTISAGRMVQALINVIENALQHGPPGSVVTVEVSVVRDSCGADLVECKVRDEGPGFTAEALGKVFEPFFTRRRGGTGLGLAIVSRILEEHGGTAEATRPEGGGGQVVLRIPITAAAAAAINSKPMSEAAHASPVPDRR